MSVIHVSCDPFVRLTFKEDNFRLIQYLHKIVCGQYCNHCVVNRYLDGSDYIGEHQDKTKDFTSGSSVFNISFGAVRTFRLKELVEYGATIEIQFQPGSLFQLGPETNEKWNHCIVKTNGVVDREERISLTFRSIKSWYNPPQIKQIVAQAVPSGEQEELKELPPPPSTRIPGTVPIDYNDPLYLKMEKIESDAIRDMGLDMKYGAFDAPVSRIGTTIAENKHGFTDEVEKNGKGFKIVQKLGGNTQPKDKK